VAAIATGSGTISRPKKIFPDRGARPLSREVFGRTFQNPVLLAAGTAGFGIEVVGVIDLTRLGGLVTKSVSLEPRHGNPAPRVAEFRGGMLNSVGLANPGVALAVRSPVPEAVALAHPAQVIVSVVGFTLDEYARVVESVAAVPGVAAVELNLSCPNTAEGGVEFGAEARSVAAVVAGCRRATEVPLVAKLSPAVPDPGHLAQAAVEAGADGITVVNTMPGRLLGAGGGSRLGSERGGVSGPALLPVGLEAVRSVVDRVGSVPVIGVGGVRTAADVRQYLRAGACLVAVGTAALADPRLPERLVGELVASGA